MLLQFSKNLSKSIKQVTNCDNPKLHEPYLSLDDLKEIKKCIKTNYVSTIGPQVKLFEKRLSKLTGAKYVIATNCGTSALHIALKAIHLEENTEVLLPSLNFVASANAVKYCNATPHFVDSNKKNLSIDAKKLSQYLKKNTFIKNNNCFNKKTKKKIQALILVHIFGLGCNIEKIKKICKIFKITLIEDAAEAIGSYYQDKHLGTFGKIGVLSFNGNKTITTGAGGAVITNDKKLAKEAYNFSTVCRKSHEWKIDFDGIGYNYRLSSLNAALGISQLKSLKKILNFKKKLFFKYKKEFRKFSEFKILDQEKKFKSNFWLNTIILNLNSINKRNIIIKYLNRFGIQARPCWALLHKLKHFQDCPKMNLDNANELEKNIINIPSSPKYGEF